MRTGSRGRSRDRRERRLIRVTKLDGTPIVLNADLIRYVEQLPDTYITLTSGDRMIVRETMERVMDLAIAYQQQKHLLPRDWRLSHSRDIPG
jgi:flagellar protein FlbD